MCVFGAKNGAGKAVSIGSHFHELQLSSRSALKRVVVVEGCSQHLLASYPLVYIFLIVSIVMAKAVSKSGFS